ncbi:hypothetical protein SAMN04490203_3029 [Pseudomonas taetrolens]|uniref:Uncharacterized protein n=1 Tax=Pseudomonas taetrolens TaxID=47884 RepID=A0A1H4V1P5_PSETA|nr:hypothetical protein SAMN04490203_3029 [Pseudomonas taetrolens]SQF87085.1 Uncharacterised protein [Pseudomonas taetrolens]VEH50280.1 Uncharacterised protein [Pseudomonas taetrolens]
MTHQGLDSEWQSGATVLSGLRADFIFLQE